MKATKNLKLDSSELRILLDCYLGVGPGRPPRTSGVPKILLETGMVQFRDGKYRTTEAGKSWIAEAGLARETSQAEAEAPGPHDWTEREPEPGDVVLLNIGTEENPQLRPFHAVWPPEKFPHDPDLVCGHVMLAPSDSFSFEIGEGGIHEAVKMSKGVWWVMSHKGEGHGFWRWPEGKGKP